jgi:hypothetical protein
MKDKKLKRTRFVGLRFTEDEFTKLESLFKESTTPQISEGIRRLLFNKPVTVKQRNKSLDDFMAEMIQLRTELNAVGKNFNQAVKKLHTLNYLQEFRGWLEQYDTDRLELLNRVAGIKDKINQISVQWLQ